MPFKKKLKLVLTTKVSKNGVLKCIQFLLNSMAEFLKIEISEKYRNKKGKTARSYKRYLEIYFDFSIKNTKIIQIS